jgi:hypothetical protein
MPLPSSIRKHGRLLEEGATGFLAGKVPVGDDDSVKCHEKSWSSFNELIKSKESAENTFGSSNSESDFPSGCSQLVRLLREQKNALAVAALCSLSLGPPVHKSTTVRHVIVFFPVSVN